MGLSCEYHERWSSEYWAQLYKEIMKMMTIQLFQIIKIILIC